MMLKPFKVHSPDGKTFYEGDATQSPIGEDAANVAIGEREAFEAWCKENAVDGLTDYKTYMKCERAWIDSQIYTRAALTAEKVAAEPVAWRWEVEVLGVKTWQYASHWSTGPKDAQPLYVAPQPVQPQVALTETQRVAIATGIKAMENCGWTHFVPDLVALLAAQPVSGGKS
jgi:hypothetical protein